MFTAVAARSVLKRLSGAVQYDAVNVSSKQKWAQEREERLADAQIAEQRAGRLGA